MFYGQAYPFFRKLSIPPIIAGAPTEVYAVGYNLLENINFGIQSLKNQASAAHNVSLLSIPSGSHACRKDTSSERGVLQMTQKGTGRVSPTGCV